MSLWLGIQLTHLPLEVFWQQNQDLPLVVCKKQRVEYASSSALEMGVKPQHSLITAWALCEYLDVKERNLNLENQRLEKLAEWALNFTPQVFIQPPNTLLLDLSGCLKVAGGWKALHHTLIEELLTLGHQHCMAIAKSADAALLLTYKQHSNIEQWVRNESLCATLCDRALAQLPLEHLKCDTTIISRLQSLGLKTWADLNRLPKEALGRRQGHSFLIYMAQIKGDRPHNRTPFTAAQHFHAHRFSLHAFKDLTFIEPIMLDMLAEFILYCRRQQLEAPVLYWRFSHNKQYQHIFDISIEYTDIDAAVILKLCLLKLERAPLKQAVDTIELATKKLIPLVSQSNDLFPDLLPQSVPSNTLLDKLQARLDHSQMSFISTVDNHQPESLLPNNETSSEVHAIRPSALLSTPRPIQLEAKALIYQHQALAIIQGPERIDTAWWQQRCARDYFIAQHPSGRRYWIFREVASKQWFVHGVFA